MCETIIQDILSYKDEEFLKRNKKFHKFSLDINHKKDIFIGVSSPILRNLVKKYKKSLDLDTILCLLESQYHEVRLFASFCFVDLYTKQKDILVKKDILYSCLINKTKYFNDWDIIDTSVVKTLGHALYNKYISFDDIEFLKSGTFFEKRIYIVSLLFFAKKQDIQTVLDKLTYFLNFDHDMINKAIGWVLREVGKTDKQKMIDFLIKNKKQIKPQTLSYAIEKLEKQEKQQVREKMKI